MIFPSYHSTFLRIILLIKASLHQQIHFIGNILGTIVVFVMGFTVLVSLLASEIIKVVNHHMINNDIGKGIILVLQCKINNMHRC